MTREEFLKKYPLPWSFEETDPVGHGAILDANGILLVRLCTDVDWEDAEVERPVFNGEFDEGTDADNLDEAGYAAERAVLVDILMNPLR